MCPKNEIPAYVLGVGLTKFIKPRQTRAYPEMGYEADVKAMLDAQINYDDVETGVACYCYGDTTSGQRTFYQFGMSGIPIYNTNNACATGSTGLHLARTLIKNGAIDRALVVGDGAGAAVIVSQKFLDARPHLKSQAILIAGQSLMTDSPQLYSKSSMDLVGYDMTKRAAQAALKEAGLNAKDIKVAELHDCFSANELILLEGLGFSEPGKAHMMVRNGDITYGGKGPIVNPSGGLISKGHPLGATGLAQCAELTWQLRGWANNRLAEGADAALQHNLGLGGAVVINVYKRADGKKNVKMSDEEVKKASQFSYNPAVEARYVTKEDGEKVRSKTVANEYALGDKLEKIQSRL